MSQRSLSLVPGATSVHAGGTGKRKQKQSKTLYALLVMCHCAVHNIVHASVCRIRNLVTHYEVPSMGEICSGVVGKKLGRLTLGA